MNNEPIPSPEPTSTSQPVTDDPAPLTTTPPVAPLPEAPKRRKKTLLVSIIAAVVVLIAAAVIFFVVQMNRANDSATSYTAAVKEHLENIYSSKTSVKDRVTLVEHPVTLTPILAGSLVSDKYRTALDLEKRYEALLSETLTPLKEIYTFLDMSSEDSFIKEIGTVATTPNSGFSVTTNNPAQLEASKAYIERSEEAAKKYTAIADRVKTYTFSADLKPQQQEVIDDITAMATAEKQRATIQREYNEKIASSGFNAEDSKKAFDAKTQADKAFVDAYGKTRTAIQQFVKDYTASDITQRLVPESTKVDKQYDDFIKSLK